MWGQGEEWAEGIPMLLMARPMPIAIPMPIPVGRSGWGPGDLGAPIS